MVDQLPPPPVPPDADLTDLKFMPLEVARLRRSKAWLICKRRPELAFYMLNLWTASWHERPAGSLEDDDDVLADAAMCSPEKWPKVREAALRGWVKCSDGRLYHPVVAEKANDSWHSRAVWRWEKECDRIRKENHRRKEKQLPPLDLPPKPERMSAVAPPDEDRTSAGSPPEKALQGKVREGKVREGKEEEEAPAPPSPPAGEPSGDRVPPEPEVLPPEVPDIKTTIFGVGLRWMITSTGSSESSCRSFLGQLIAQHGESKTASVLMAAERARPVDPRAWMKRNIEGANNGPRPRNGQATSLDGESAVSAGIAAAIARRSFSDGG